MAEIMRRNYLIVLSVSIVLALASSSFAQRPAAPTAQPTPTTPTTQAPANPANLPVCKMAVIYTDAFLDAKNGINKFTTIVNKLNGEFQAIKNDLTQMQNRAQQLQEEISKLQGAPSVPIDQKSLQAKIDQLEQLKRDITRKSEDAQSSYNKRRQELFAPLQDEIGKALEAYAKARSITAIIDGAQVPLLYAADSTDITRAFIADFNSKNPATAQVAPPK